MPITSKTLKSIFPITGLLAIALLNGCAELSVRPTQLPQNQLVSKIQAQDNLRWWYAKFSMVWPENAAPQFSNDLLIADQIIEPILEAQTNGIKLWRFHRRAIQDAAGHQFSFIFYAGTDTADIIYTKIANNPLLQQLIRDQVIHKFTKDSATQNQRKRISDTSDPAWPASLQTAWPSFIMGASTMWLELIDHYAAQQTMPAGNTQALLEQYQDIHQDITAIWKDKSQHALFHHLNALFGYEAMYLRKSLRF